MRLYGELTKVEELDDGTIRVLGVASTGARDEAGETVAPEAIKAALPDYLAFGAVREMHQLSAAGTTLGAEVDEDGVTRIETHIVDPVAIRKVKAGVYKGFSIGGKVLARDPDDRSRITALKLNEISLVDRPCNPEAIIDLWKADQTRDHRMPHTPTNEAVRAEAQRLAKAAGKPRWQDFVVRARERLVKAAQAAPPPKADPSAKAPDPAPKTPTAAQSQPAADDAPASAADGLDLDAIQAAHDQLVLLGAQCDPANCGHAPADAEDEPAMDAEPEDEAEEHAKALADNRRLSDPLAKTAPRIEALAARLDEQARELARLKAMPLPARTAGGGFAKAVGKDEDALGHGRVGLSAEAVRKALDEMSPDERAFLLTKAALSRPIPLG